MKESNINILPCPTPVKRFTLNTPHYIFLLTKYAGGGGQLIILFGVYPFLKATFIVFIALLFSNFSAKAATLRSPPQPYTEGQVVLFIAKYLSQDVQW